MGELSAIFSVCGQYRHRLDWSVYPEGVMVRGLTFLFAGVNPSTAGRIGGRGYEEPDQTARKWLGFTRRNGGVRFIAINPLDYIATDVRKLASVPMPCSPENRAHIDAAVAEADVLVPCWGNRGKVPKSLHHHFDQLLGLMRASGKPVLTFGLTLSGDPKHPLTLGYDMPLVPLSR